MTFFFLLFWNQVTEVILGGFIINRTACLVLVWQMLLWISETSMVISYDTSYKILPMRAIVEQCSSSNEWKSKQMVHILNVCPFSCWKHPCKTVFEKKKGLLHFCSKALLSIRLSFYFLTIPPFNCSRQ